MSAVKQRIAYCSVAAVLTLVAQLYPNSLRTSPEGLKLLSGYEDCTLSSYYDTVGVPTCGIGHTKGVRMGQVATPEKVAQWFVQDVQEAEQCVIRYFNGAAMPQPVFDSTVSLVFNVGCYGTRWNAKHNRPTFIARFAKAEDWYKTCEHIADFSMAGGKVSKGLENRRKKEQAHCIKYKQ
ncbi:lysozyme [Aeromonas phage ZPAH7B]|uniref:Endolysin n=2 Tax=Aerosvirus ZPAH7 TaxID=2733366 RepID=A0A3Q9GFM1_9CAUD|nr:endolysin [Aeromonas phage ZPAH7]AZQ96383.1 lysozyme [Aeromonas phage ZPAH7]QAX95963.1 lysozyme [Aeromonas phage ZPAH7B]